MNAVQFIIFALCIYQISAATYEEAVTICRKESNIEDSKTVDYFFKHAAWPVDASAPCYFNCLGKQLGAVDEAGVPSKSILAKIASQLKGSKDLALITEPTLSTCISKTKGPTACAASESYITCALRNKAAASVRPRFVKF